MNKNNALFIIVTFLLYGCMSTHVNHDTAIVNAINKNALEITDYNSDFGSVEQKALDTLFKDARIFGFGEATHGTKEFSDLKTKFFKYLVKNKGVKNFAIEVSYGNSVAIDNYIKGEEDKAPKELLDEIGPWTLKTEELLALIEWMRVYNQDQAKSEQLHFYGIDIMDVSKSAELMIRKLKEISLDNKDTYLGILHQFLSKDHSKPLKNKELKEYLKEMLELKEAIHNSPYSHDNLLVNLQNAIVQYLSFHLDENQENRDRAMAENVSHLLDYSQKNSKVFIWAHNFHIKKNKITFTSDYAMGHFLKKKYGDRYYAIGFDFSTGAFNAYNIKAKKVERYSIDQPLKNTSSALFSKSTLDCFFIDFKSIKKDGVMGNYLNSKVKYRGIGSTYNPKMVETERLKEAYDGIIFVKNTTPTTFIK